MDKFWEILSSKLAEKGLVVLVILAFGYYIATSQHKMIEEMRKDKIESDKRILERVEHLEKQSRMYHEDLIDCLHDRINQK